MYHRGSKWTYRRGVCDCPYGGGIGDAKGRGGAGKGVTGAGGTNDAVSGAASGDGGTGLLEGTAKCDGELEGTEHEFSASDIYCESVSFS